MVVLAVTGLVLSLLGSSTGGVAIAGFIGGLIIWSDCDSRGVVRSVEIFWESCRRSGLHAAWFSGVALNWWQVTRRPARIRQQGRISSISSAPRDNIVSLNPPVKPHDDMLAAAPDDIDHIADHQAPFR